MPVYVSVSDSVCCAASLLSICAVKTEVGSGGHDACAPAYVCLFLFLCLSCVSLSLCVVITERGGRRRRCCPATLPRSSFNRQNRGRAGLVCPLDQVVEALTVWSKLELTRLSKALGWAKRAPSASPFDHGLNASTMWSSLAAARSSCRVVELIIDQ